jgi:lipopolysaccharide heptosyltransferase I
MEMSALGSFNHILIIKPSSLGDIVHCFPVVDQIRKTFPDASIDWVANTEFLPLVRRYPGVRRGIAFPRSRWGKVSFFPSFGRFLQDLRQESYDAVLDAQGLLRSALIARGSRGAIRIGFSDAREGAVGLYSEVISLDGTSGILHAVRKNLRLLEPLGIAPEYSLQRLTYSAQDQENLEKILLRASADFQGNFFVLHPGAKRSIKRWPSLYFSDLLNAIHRHYPGIRPVLVGGAEDTLLLEEVAARTRTSPVLLPGLVPIDLLPLLFEKALFYVGNDSGPLHLAVMAGIPTVSFYGSSTPERTGPFDDGKGTHVVLGDKVACSPCGDFRKFCDHQSCLVGVTPEAAFSGVRALMERLQDFSRGKGSLQSA